MNECCYTYAGHVKTAIPRLRNNSAKYVKKKEIETVDNIVDILGGYIVEATGQSFDIDSSPDTFDAGKTTHLFSSTVRLVGMVTGITGKNNRATVTMKVSYVNLVSEWSGVNPVVYRFTVFNDEVFSQCFVDFFANTPQTNASTFTCKVEVEVDKNGTFSNTNTTYDNTMRLMVKDEGPFIFPVGRSFQIPFKV